MASLEKMKIGKRIALQYYKIKFKTIGLFAPETAARIAFELFCTPYSGKPKRTEPLIFEKAENIELVTEGNITLRGWCWQPEDDLSNGKKILILHGFDSCAYKFEKYIRPLRKEGFTVYAFDAPGHGISDGKTINSLQYKKAIIKIDETFGSFYGIMAHSIGGLAVSLATEKLFNLKKLVLIAPAVEITRPIEYFANMVGLSVSLKEAFYNYIIKIGGFPISYYDSRKAMKAVIDTLWLHDKEDKICPFEDVEPLIEFKPKHITFHITNGLGHSNIYREPTIVKEIINFFVK